jgi:Dolichyl-phosphate-mannose-protein mannosyltransferase
MIMAGLSYKKSDLIADGPPVTTKADDLRYLRVMAWMLYAIAVWSFAWPVYRAFLNIEIENNEGWNAYFADAAMGKMPLYPSADQLITNNYPPLSFYIVGLVGRLVGDPVLAGRLLSLIAVVAIAAAIALSVRRLGGSSLAARISAAFYVATMSRFYVSYAGMDEPQLLGEAIMAFGFLGFLIARSNDRGFVGPVLVMVLAGFVKHNVIAMPLTAFLWLGLHRRREAVKCLWVATIAVITGMAICYALFGRNFFLNILSPRRYSLMWELSSLRDLEWVSVGLLACVYNAWARRRDDSVQLCSCFIGIALASDFLQKTGAGVYINAQFDLIITVAMGFGLAFTQISLWPIARSLRSGQAQAILLLVVCVRLLVSKQLQPVRLVFDRSFINEIAMRERAMSDSVERVRRIPGDVLCGALVSYRAGKPFVVDEFNVEQRILAGQLSKDAITARVAAGTLTIVEVDRRTHWSKPADLSPTDEALVDFMKHSQAVYVFPLESKIATRPDDKDLRLLDTQARQTLFAVLSNQANWYHGLMTVEIGPYGAGSVGFVFRRDKDDLTLFVNSDCTAGCIVEGKLRGKRIFGILNESAQPAIEDLKERYASRGTGK